MADQSRRPPKGVAMDHMTVRNIEKALTTAHLSQALKPTAGGSHGSQPTQGSTTPSPAPSKPASKE